MWVDSIASERKAVELDPGRSDLLLALANAYRDAGQFAEAKRTVAEWRKRADGKLDTFYTGIGIALLDGRRDEALAMLETAYREHSGSLILINVEPTLRPLRSEPRFQSVVHGLHLDRSHG